MIVTYERGPLVHLLGGCPGLVISAEIVSFNGVHVPCSPGCVDPALAWGRKGAEEWLGPFPTWDGAAVALAPLIGGFSGHVMSLLERGRNDPNGATAIYEAWNWRIAWGNGSPPSRFDNRPG